MERWSSVYIDNLKIVRSSPICDLQWLQKRRHFQSVPEVNKVNRGMYFSRKDGGVIEGTEFCEVDRGW